MSVSQILEVLRLSIRDQFQSFSSFAKTVFNKQGDDEINLDVFLKLLPRDLYLI